jgi:hypothetical protein
MGKNNPASSISLFLLAPYENGHNGLPDSLMGAYRSWAAAAAESEVSGPAAYDGIWRREPTYPGTQH